MMIAKGVEDGGPAFKAQYPGLTVRDYFAAKAMQAYCSMDDTKDWSVWEIASNAYEQADAMLAERLGTSGEE
jgi:hypothetical protein